MMPILVAALVLVLVPGWAFAHGPHDSVAPTSAGAPVRAQRYWVELMTHPAPLVLGEQNHLVVKVTLDPARTPVSGARVLIRLDAAAAAEAHAAHAAPAAEAHAGHAAHASHSHESDLAQASETTWAGQYELAVTPERRGPHRAHVVLSEAEGTPLTSPLVMDFPVSVERAPGMGGAVWSLLALCAGVGVLGVYAVRLRARSGAGASEPLNLLDIGWLRRLLTARAFPLSLQIPLLALMAVVVFLGFHDVQEGGVNFATKVTWTIWWAGIIFTFVLLGRVWCLACPFGAVNEWASRLVAPLRRLPRPFRNIWWATGLFVLLTWADEQLGVVRSPRVTAWIVVFFAALALAVGLFFERRSFCRYLCPIGGVIGLYSMTAPLELRVRDAATCRAHREKTCYRGSDTTYGCPMLEFPQTMDRNNYCTLCAECAKGCSRDNLVLRLRGFGRDLWATGRRAMDESYLAVVLVGLTFLVTAQMLTAWSGWTSALAGWLPGWVRGTLKPVSYLGFVESGVLLGGSLVIGPLLVLAAAALADRSAGQEGLGVRRTFVLFGYMFVPIGLAMHLAHNLAHLLLEGGGIVPAAQRALALYTPLWLGEPEWPGSPLATASVVSLLQMMVIAGFFVMSLVAGHRLALRAYPSARVASRAFVPMAMLSLAFTLVAIVLLNQPMGMRHGM